MFTVTGQFLISQKFFKKQAKSFDSYRATILSNEKIISTEYVANNFTKSFSCLNWKLSEYQIDTDCPDILEDWDKIVLVREKLPKDENIFRLYEDKVIIIATDQAKDAIEREGLTGIEFVEIECV